MSHSVDERYEVYTERVRVARKQHQCSACRETIAAGHQYAAIFVCFEGEARAIKRCARCQRMHLHLRDLGYNTWPAEKLDCGRDYAYEWGGPPPPEIEALAFALPGELTLRSEEP